MTGTKSRQDGKCELPVLSKFGGCDFFERGRHICGQQLAVFPVLIHGLVIAGHPGESGRRRGPDEMPLLHLDGT